MSLDEALGTAVARYCDGGALLPLRQLLEDEAQPLQAAEPCSRARAAEVVALLREYDSGELDAYSLRAMLGWRFCQTED
jgi:hypothetical protein